MSKALVGVLTALNDEFIHKLRLATCSICTQHKAIHDKIQYTSSHSGTLFSISEQDVSQA